MASAGWSVAAWFFGTCFGSIVSAAVVGVVRRRRAHSLQGKFEVIRRLYEAQLKRSVVKTPVS